LEVENEHDPVCEVKDRRICTFVGGCPLRWASRLQPEIAPSTVEAEYIALSTAMRDLLPARALLKEIGKNLAISLQGVCYSKQGLGQQHKYNLVGRSSKQGDPQNQTAYCSEVSFLLQSFE